LVDMRKAPSEEIFPYHNSSIIFFIMHTSHNYVTYVQIILSQIEINVNISKRDMVQ